VIAKWLHLNPIDDLCELKGDADLEQATVLADGVSDARLDTKTVQMEFRVARWYSFKPQKIPIWAYFVGPWNG
jgi:hypothetical protein